MKPELQEWVGDDWQEVTEGRTEADDQVYERMQAAEVARSYVCATCWGPLLITPVDQEHDLVKCANYDEHRGFHSKYFRDRRTSDNIGEAMEVKQMLRQAGVIQYTKRSADEVLKDLGF